MILSLAQLRIAGVTLEDPRTEDLSQEVRGFIFSKILVCKLTFVFGHTRDNDKFVTFNKFQPIIEDVFKRVR